MEVVKRKTPKNKNGNEISYTHFKTGSNRICFMFSGTGYTYGKPILYYATMALLKNQIDVVHTHYSYEGELFKRPLDEITRVIMNDVNPVVFEVSKDTSYGETIFLGKSLGTIPLMGEFMRNERYSNSKMILLTPLFKKEPLFQTVLTSSHRGLIVIGDKDPHYDEEQIKRVEQTNFNVTVVQDANHSLDIEGNDWEGSISSLRTVMEKVEQTILM